MPKSSASDSDRIIIADDIAWVDAIESGREVPATWVCHLPSGNSFELRDAAWLIWSYIAEGQLDFAELAESVLMSDVVAGMTSEDVYSFVSSLAEQRLVQII